MEYMQNRVTVSTGKEDDKSRRKYEIKVRLNHDEKRILDAKVKISNSRSRESFLRQLIVHGYVYEADFRPVQEMNAELGKIGSNINQIARAANTSGTVSSEQIESIKEGQQKIWQLQKSILSKLRRIEA